MPYTYDEQPSGAHFAANGAHLIVDPSDTVFHPVVPVLQQFTRDAATAEETYLPERLPAAVNRLGAQLLSASSTALSGALAHARERAEVEVRALTPPPAVAEQADRFGSEIRATFRALDVGAREGKARDGSLSAIEVAALMPMLDTLNLTTEAREALRDHARKVFHIERAGLSAGNARKPTLGAILATGVDREAVAAQAEQAFVHFHAERALVSQREATLQHLVAYLAAALSIEPSEALERIAA